MKWRVPRMWEDGDVWIIGGGPSMPKQFDIPDQVIRNVVSGTSPASVYSPYMSFLHDKHVVGINVAYKIGDWIDIVFFGDNNFFFEHKEDLARFPGLKMSCHSQVEPYSWVKYLEKDPKGRGISDNPDMVCWNNNSGAAAISVAVNAGAKRVILLGFDMKLGEDKMQHWHDLYGKGECIDQRRIQKLPFDRHLRSFMAVKADAKKRGVEILNCSPESMITEFPKFSMKELAYSNI
jgi:hypothetical protein